MSILNKNKIGLVVGLFLALVHLVWAIIVWIMPNGLQSFLDWIFALHGLESYMTIVGLTLVNAIFLIIMTFIFGYIFGWVFVWVHNLNHKK